MHRLLPVGASSRHWPARLSPTLVRCAWYAAPLLLRGQEHIDSVQIAGVQHLRTALANGSVLLTPNHANYADPVVLMALARAVNRPFLFLTAWQVFGTRPAPARWLLQRLGCFSVDRERGDIAAFREAVRHLSEGRHPLVIFPEGEMYRTNGLVSPFHDGPAAIARAAAKGGRTIAAVPVAIRYRLAGDIAVSLSNLAGRLERALFWSPRPDWPIVRRVERLAEGALALKEIEHRGGTRTGPLAERVQGLLDAVLDRHTPNAGDPVSRILTVRRRALSLADADPQRRAMLDDAAFAGQLVAYPAGYLGDQPSQDRLAETVLKLEEDILGTALARVPGRLHARISVGEPLAVIAESRAPALTRELQRRVQALLDEEDPR